MTKEEAINVLNDWDGYFVGHSSDNVYEALDMAIEALKQEPCEDCISRSRIKEVFHRNVAGAEAFDVLFDSAPSVQPKVSEGEGAINGIEEGIRCAMCTNSMKSDRGCDGGCVVDDEMYRKVIKVVRECLPSVQTKRRTGEWMANAEPWDTDMRGETNG